MNVSLVKIKITQNTEHKGNMQSLNTSQLTLYEESGEETSIALQSTPRFRRTSSDLQDMVPQLPIRKDSSSLQSLSLYDLDPQDSLPRVIPHRQQQQQQQQQLHMPLRKRTQHHRLPENSSSGSSTLGPPTSVLVPTESQWSAVSTLMTCEEARETILAEANADMPPRRDEESQVLPPVLPPIHKEMLVKLPWDKIAIGLVMVPENDTKDTPPTTRMRYPSGFSEDKSSECEDTISYPSFHFSSESHSIENTMDSCGIQTIEPGKSPQCCSIPTTSTNKQQPSPPCDGILPMQDSHNEHRLQSHPTTTTTLHASHHSLLPVDHSDGIRHAGQLYPSQHALRNVTTTSTATALYSTVSTPLLERHSSRGHPTRDMPRLSYDQGPVRSSHSDNNGSHRLAPMSRSSLTSTGSINISTPMAVGGVMIDVAPGIKLPLRGADETWEAIEEGRVTVTTCLSCNIELQCLDNAQLVACPDCTMLSPVDQASDSRPDINNDRYGVGVGVKPSDIVRWIQQQQQQQQPQQPVRYPYGNF